MKLLPNHRSRLRSAVAITLFSLSAGLIGPAIAEDFGGNDFDAVKLTSEQSTVNRDITQTIERSDMLVKSSRILTLEGRIPRFQIHNEAILTATPVSESQIQLYAKTAGTTQINLWDANQTLYTVDVTVNPDAREIEGILSSQLPFASIKVLPVGGGAIVSGSVTSVDDVDRAVAIAEQFYPTIVNNIKVVGVQQVLLHTRIMEVSRTKLRSLGVDWVQVGENNVFASAASGIIDLNASSLVQGGFDIANASVQQTQNLFTNNFTLLIEALKEQQLVKFLAEPTVVATHGRPARFNVGGRVPYITPGGNGTVSIGYEEFGTSVDFLPFVVGPGRVRLEVRPEVTDLDPSRSVTVQGAVVPGFSQRYVETAVELQVGQTFALAGLLQTRVDTTSRRTPILGDIPLFGSVFRRVRHQRNDIELLITVTPELVAAMDPYERPVGGPGLNSMQPTDRELFSGGYLEVPNLNAKPNDCSPVVHGQRSRGPAAAGSCAPGQSPVYGSPSGPVVGGSPSYALPPGSIVPNDTPVIVGDGVTVQTAPAGDTYFNAPQSDPSAAGSGASQPGQIVEGF